MKKDLNAIEKAYISRRGKIDANVSAIKIKSFGDLNEVVVFSPYIIEELAKLSADSKNLFLKKHAVFLVNDKGKRKYRYLSFNDAIIQIEKCINLLKTRMDDDKAFYNIDKEKLYYLLDESKKNQALHLIRMYELKLMDINAKIKNIEYKTKSNIEFLLNEKIRLLKKALIYQDYLESCCSYKLQHYYDRVCQSDKKYPMAIINIKDYSDIFNNSFSNWYEEQIILTQEKIENIRNY